MVRFRERGLHNVRGGPVQVFFFFSFLRKGSHQAKSKLCEPPFVVGTYFNDNCWYGSEHAK